MADTGPYDIGDEVTLQGTFKVGDTLTNPNAVTCRVRKPDGTLVTPNPTATSVSTGVYEAKVQPDQSGEWVYRFEGTGAAMAAGERIFLVRPKRA